MRSHRLALSSRTVVTLLAYAWMALSGAIHSSSAAFAASDADQIRSLIGSTWDKPESKVETDPVIISGNYAVASWTQGESGGRALLRHGNAGWSVVLCSGDPLKDAKWLAEAGVPRSDADRIARDLEAAEKLVHAERRDKFSLFEGVISSGRDHHGSHRE